MSDLKAMFEDLKMPFSEDELEWRILQSGKTNGKPWAKAAAYVDARAVQDRLDVVVGPENWKVEYQRLATGTMCRLWIKCGDEWVFKEDGADDPEWESFKGGISSALRRAASIWGIGRYLYSMPETFVQFVDKGVKGARWHKDKTTGESYYWIVPVAGAPQQTSQEGVENGSFGSSGTAPVHSGASVVPPSGLVMKFGKYKGVPAEQLLHTDPSYVDWFIDKSMPKEGKFFEQGMREKEQWRAFRDAATGQAALTQNEDIPF